MRALSLALAAAALVGALAFVTLRSQARSSDAFDRAVDTVRDLRGANAHLVLLVTRARFQVSRNYDPLVRVVEQLARTERELAPGRLASYGAGQPGVDAARGAIYAANAQQAEWVEDFKSDNAVLRNAVSYLPLAAEQVADLARTDGSCPESAPLAVGLAAAVLSQVIAPTPEREAVLAERVARLDATRARCSDAVRPHVDAVLAQARAAIRYRGSVDEAVSRLTAVPSGARYDALFAAQQRCRQSELRAADAYRVVLGTMSALLAVAILAAIVRLMRGARALAAANARIAHTSSLLRAALSQLLDAEQLALLGRAARDLVPEIARRLAFARELAASARAHFGAARANDAAAAGSARLAECERSLAGLAALVTASLEERPSADDDAAEPAPTRVADVLARCVDELAALRPAGSVRAVACDCPREVQAQIDPDDLETVLGHVLAFLHDAGEPGGGARGPIVVRARVDGGAPYVWFLDAELALTEGERRALFAGGESGDGGTRPVARLRRHGLAIAERVTRRSGGELRLEPATERGTAFRLRLAPAAAA